MFTSLAVAALSIFTLATGQRGPRPVNTTTCNGETYVYHKLAGYGFAASSATDKFQVTLGGLGSAIALDRSSWKRISRGYQGTIWCLPDRGWNTQGTLNYNPRVHQFTLTFMPRPAASLARPSGPNIFLDYVNTIILRSSNGGTTGLDPDGSGALVQPGQPDLPVATYTGNGFGGPGPGGRKIAIDSEGLVLMPDGTFWVSDEYGPYIYRFSAEGVMLGAIRPPEAIIPMRNGSQSFSANSPTAYSGLEDDVNPPDPESGRNNNQGLEGLTVSDDGSTLYALMQSACVQEGGLSSSTRRYARLLVYDISDPTDPTYTAEYVVPLPIYTTSSGSSRVAAQSEIHYVSATQFLVLARDSSAGHGQDSSQSLYRQADVFDIASATNIAGPTYDCATCAIADADSGALDPAIAPATYCPFIDFNDNAQLGRFGVHNGGAQDAGLLNEKWESFALAPVNPDSDGDGQFFLFSFSDNDFITQNGHLMRGRYNYSDASGFELDNQVLAFRVTLPANPAT